MCFNGKKNLESYNKGMKRKLQEYLRILQTSDMLGADGVMQLEEIRSKLINSPANSSHIVGMIDYKVLRYLEDAQQDIVSSSSRIFGIRMRKIKEAMARRDIEAKRAASRPRNKEEAKEDKIVAKKNKKLDKQFASNPIAFLEKNVTVDELYSTDDFMLITISGLQDEVDALNKRAEELCEALIDNPEDFALNYELQKVQDTLEKRRICQQMLMSQAVRERAYELFETIDKQDKLKISKRKIEDDQYELLRKRAAKILEGNGIYSATVAGTAKTSADMTAATVAPEGKTVPSAPVVQRPTVPVTPAMEKKRLEKAQKAIEEKSEALKVKIETWDEELYAIDKEMLRLIRSRKGKPQLEGVKTQLQDLKHQQWRLTKSIERARQALNYCNESLNVIGMKQISGETAQIDEILNKTIDVSNIAVEVVKETEAGNEAMERARTSSMVIDSVKVDTESSLSEIPDIAGIDEQFENECEQLEAEIKRRRGEI